MVQPPAAANQFDHKSYIEYRQQDTNWHQQQVAFSHKLYTGLSVAATNDKQPKTPAELPAPEAILSPGMVLFQNPELFAALSSHPLIWKELKAQNSLFCQLLAKPSVLLQLLGDDSQRQMLETVLKRPELQQLLFD